ncbi:MAG: choice-of-anchor Q domain-containing protein, partial [Planctomycetota bacterium]
MLAADVTVSTVSDVNDGDTASIAALVSDPGSDGVISLREAIAAANNTAGANTIGFDPSVFTGGASSLIRLSGTELAISETLTIDGSTGTDVVITADASGNDTLVAGAFVTDVAASLANNATSLNDNSRVINFTAVSGDLNLNGLIITGGRTTGFGERGGGIQFRSEGVLTVAQGDVSGNSTVGDSADGGGISAFPGAVTLTSSTVSGNSATGIAADGGGIYAYSGAVTLTSSTISGNSSSDDGGGIKTDSGDVMLTSSTVSGNSSSFYGGGIHSFEGSVTLNSSTLSGNSSIGNGGGIYTFGSTVSITGSTLTGNTAAGVGGGVGLRADNFNDNERITIRNSIIAGNSDNGTAPDLQAVGDPANDQIVNFSLIGDTTGSGVTAATGTGNLLGIDPLLGLLADNGGPTLTNALLAGSPALNAGDPAFASPPAFDQRGPGFARVLTGRVDIGAFEAQPVLPPQGLVVSTTTDVFDGDFSVGQLSLREAIGFANDLAGANTITFDSGVFTGGASSLIRLIGTELAISETLTIDGSSGTDVVITADASGNDTLVAGTFITDVAASLAADATSLNDNSRVINFTVASGDLTLSGLTVTGGRTLANGGGIGTVLGNVVLTSSTVSGNQSNRRGGGIFAFSGGVTLTGSTISGNTSQYGGGIYTNDSTVSITSSTIAGNTAGGVGGGLGLFADNYNDNERITIRNSIIAGNSDNGTAPDLQAVGDPANDQVVNF